MKHLKHLLYLRRLRNAVYYLRLHLEAYESLMGVWAYEETVRREYLNDLYKMKDRYNTEKYSWMKRI